MKKEIIPQLNIMNQIQKDFFRNLHDKLDNYFIAGLKRKGFEFDRPSKLASFIKQRCRCEDNVHLKQRVYFVDETPFFLHNYSVDIDTEFKIEDRKTTLSATFGTYCYL